MNFWRVCDEFLARNPVARAIARRHMVASVRDFLIALYNAPDGSNQGEAAQSAAMALAIAIRIQQRTGKGDDPETRVMAGAMSALTACAKRGFLWSARDATAVDAGLTRALAIVTDAPPSYLSEAWRFVRDIEVNLVDKSLPKG